MVFMKIKSRNIFLVLFILFILSLIYANFFLVRSIGGDASVIGLMAKHTITKGKLHYFYYGQYYNGAGAIVSYLLIPFILLWDVSSLSVNLLLLLINIIFFILFYIIIFKIFNEKIANLSLLFFLFASNAFLLLRLTKLDYLISLILNTLLFYFFYKSVVEEGKIKYLILFGLTAAIAHWAFEFVLPLLFMMLVFWFIKDKQFFIKRRFGIFFASLLIGEIPLIIYNLKHNFANIKQLFAGTFIHRFVCEHNLLPGAVDFGGRIVNHCKIFGDTKIKSSLSTTLETIHSFFGDGTPGYIYLLVFLISLAYLLFLNYDNFKLIFKDIFRLNNSKIKKLKFIEIFIISYLLLYFLAYLVSGFSDTQHLLPIYPFLAIAMGISFNHFFSLQKAKQYSIMGIVLLCLVIFSSIISYISIIDSGNKDDESNIINFLNENEINYVYTTYFIKWKLLFQSNEDIIASCRGLCPCGYRYPLYEEVVSKQDKTAIILWNDSLLNAKLRDYLHEKNIIFSNFGINSKTIYYTFSERVLPSDFIHDCKFGDGLLSDSG